MIRGLSILVLAGILSTALACSDALGEEVLSQEVHSPARGLYLGGFIGDGISTNHNITQSGTAFLSPARGGPLAVNAVGGADNHTAFIGGLHLGYEWPGWRLGKEGSGWSLLPAAEFEGYYLGSSQSGHLINPTDRIPEHRFAVSFPMEAGVFLANTVLTFHTPYKIHPYVGVGAGAAYVSIRGADSSQLNPSEPGINHFNSNPNASNWSFAAQAKSGVRAEVVEHWWLFAEYRLLYVAPTDYTFGATNYPTHAVTSEWNVQFGSMFYNVGVVGIEYSFGR